MVLAQDLRDAVLQAALQGKLTEQLDSDSSVDIILQNIEKKNNTIIDINFEESFLKSIPSNWKYVRLGDLLFIARGGSPRPIQAYLTENENGVNWIKIGDTEIGGKYIYSTKEKIKKEGMKKSRYVKEGDFLLTNSMSFGRPYILKTHGCIHDGWLVLSDEWNCFIQDYLYWLLSSSLVFIQFSGMASGAVVKNLNIDKVKATIIPLPPIEEQQRIVDRVNELMEKIDEYEKVEMELEALEQKFPDDMKNALLQAAMQGKLAEQLDSDSSVDEMLEAIKEEKKQLLKEKKIKKEKPLPLIKGDEIPFEIPDNWKWIRWGDLAYSIQYGYNAPAKENGKIKMVRISDIQNNKVIWETVPYCEIEDGDIETYLLKENDILFARTGGTVGKSFLVKEVEEKAIYAGYLIRTRYSNKLIAQYLKCFMESQLYWVQLQNGKTKGCQPNCNGQTLSKMIIPLPPVEEQQRIVERLEQLLPLCETL